MCFAASVLCRSLVAYQWPVCVCVLFLAGLGGQAPRVRFCAPPLSFDCFVLLLSSAPSGIGLPFSFFFLPLGPPVLAPALSPVFSSFWPRVPWALAFCVPPPPPFLCLHPFLFFSLVLPLLAPSLSPASCGFRPRMCLALALRFSLCFLAPFFGALLPRRFRPWRRAVSPPRCSLCSFSPSSLAASFFSLWPFLSRP